MALCEGGRVVTVYAGKMEVRDGGRREIEKRFKRR